MRPSAVSAALALLIALFTLAACSQTSQTATVASSPAPSVSPSVDFAEHHGRKRHHRHHREAGNVVASASVQPTVGAGGSWPCNDQQFLSDQQEFANGTISGDQEVDVCGNVTQVLPSQTTRSGLHGYYDVQVAAGVTIEIVCDLGDMDAPAWPWVKSGDYSYVQGRYYYDSSSSQGIDWTHHGTSRSWSTPGFVVIDGTEYQ